MTSPSASRPVSLMALCEVKFAVTERAAMVAGWPYVVAS